MDLGANVHFITSNDKLRPDDVASYQTVSTVSKNADIDEWISTARALHKVYQFTKVGCFHEKTQVIAAKVAKGLCILHQPAELFELVQKKNLLRELLIKNNLDMSFYYYIENSTDLIKKIFLEKKMPLIAKPVDGYASIGINRIDRVEDVESVSIALKSVSHNEKIYLEQLIIGKEYSVEVFSANGKHYLLALTTKYNETTRFIDLGHVLPTFNEDSDRIFQKVKAMLNLIEYGNGISHTEVIVNDSDVFITETHCRIAGDYIPEMLNNSFDIDLRELIAKQFLDICIKKELEALRFNGKYSAIWFKRPLKDGKITKIEQHQDDEKLLNIVQKDLYCKLGEVVENYLETSSRLAFSMNHGKSQDEAVQNSLTTLENMKIIIE